MMNDKPIKVQNTPEKMVRIAEMLECFTGRKYYPANERAFNAAVEAIADIVYDKPNGWLWDKKNEDGSPKIEPNLGFIENDLDWLKQQAIATFTFCPTPKHLRALYCQHFKAADGRQINMDVEDM